MVYRLSAIGGVLSFVAAINPIQLLNERHKPPYLGSKVLIGPLAKGDPMATEHIKRTMHAKTVVVREIITILRFARSRSSSVSGPRM
jgi:hypothetical protein